MNPAILVLNAGSSSVKYRLIEPDTSDTRCSGLVERIGEEGSRVRHTWGATTTEQDVEVP